VKKLIIIVGVCVVLGGTILTLLVYYFLDKEQYQKNFNQTSAARQNRWKVKEETKIIPLPADVPPVEVKAEEQKILEPINPS